MKHIAKNVFNTIFKNKQGNIVIWQMPNAPLWGWIMATILTKIVQDGVLNTALQIVAGVSLLAWAYLEIRYGDSLFRRVLGSLALTYIIWSNVFN